MLTVLCLGSEGENHLFSFLTSALSNVGKLLCLFPKQGAVCEQGFKKAGAPDFLLSSFSQLSEIQAPEAVCLLSGGFVQGNALLSNQRSKAFCLLCDSSDPQALQLAEESRLPVLTCGLRSTDCFTFSSLGEDSRMFYLQRPLSLPGGGLLEPFERSAPACTNQPLFYQLAFYGLLTLSGLWPGR